MLTSKLYDDIIKPVDNRVFDTQEVNMKCITHKIVRKTAIFKSYTCNFADGSNDDKIRYTVDNFMKNHPDSQLKVSTSGFDYTYKTYTVTYTKKIYFHQNSNARFPLSGRKKSF
jgi:hypothetical protein